MFKNILRLLTIGLASSFLISSCKEDDGVPYTYTSEIDAKGTDYAKNTKIAHYQEHMVLLFSTDGGVTFSNIPALKEGQAYKAKVYFNGTTGANAVPASDLSPDVYTYDWSQSNPKPTGEATGDVADFTLSGSNLVKVKVSNTHCPFDASSWVGDWKGHENGACCGGTDDLTIRQDSSDPNRLIMTNFWNDGAAVEVYFDMIPSTSFFDQNITLPAQTTSEGGEVLAGTGTYDQCAGTLKINTKYKYLDGNTYSWVYELYRAE